MKTLLVGIDALGPAVLDLFEEGELEALESLRASGASGTLESQIPPWTASAWPSIYTGKNPGKHGVFGFLDFDGYDWSVVNATHVRARAIWEYLDFHGLSSVVVNVPVTHPPVPFDGALIPGYVAPENPTCHPEDLLDDVRAATDGYRIYAPRDVEGDELVAWFRRLIRMRGDAFAYLVAEYQPDFGFVQFQQTDTVFHKRPDDLQAIRAVYHEVDAQIGEILEVADPDTVIVVSDHGIGPYEKHEFRLNDYLAEKGYLSTVRGGRGMPTWVTVRDEHLREGIEEVDVDRGPLAKAVAAAARMGITTERVASLLKTVGLADVVAEYVPGSVHRAGTLQVHFRASTAYMRDRIELGVRINLEGREPDGEVPQSDYEEVRERIIHDLRSVTTPAGERVFEAVVPRDVYFQGPAAADAVDIVTVPTNFDYLLSAQLEGEPFGPITEPWHHKLEGLVVGDGVAVTPDRSVESACIFDVAPTVLASLGIPASTDMDGEPLPIVDSVGDRSYPPPPRREAVETADTGIEERLSDLGYIE